MVLEKEAKGLLERISHGEERGYSFILELLLRMRQFSVRIFKSFICEMLIVGSLVVVS